MECESRGVERGQKGRGRTYGEWQVRIEWIAALDSLGRAREARGGRRQLAARARAPGKSDLMWKEGRRHGSVAVTGQSYAGETDALGTASVRSLTNPHVAISIVDFHVAGPVAVSSPLAPSFWLVGFLRHPSHHAEVGGDPTDKCALCIRGFAKACCSLLRVWLQGVIE